MGRQLWTPETPKFDGSKFKTADAIAKEILDFLDPLDDIELAQPTHVLTAIYLMPEKRGSIIMIDETRLESVYQGTAFLILKMGSHAFKEHAELGLDVPRVGDWVVARGVVNEIHQVIKGYECRVFDHTQIVMKIKHPAMVY